MFAPFMSQTTEQRLMKFCLVGVFRGIVNVCVEMCFVLVKILITGKQIECLKCNSNKLTKQMQQSLQFIT